MHLRRSKRVFNSLVALAVVAGASSAAFATEAATADAPTAPVVHPRLFATAPANVSRPDDLTLLDGLLYVTYQNNAAADGSPPGSHSTIVAFNRQTGQAVATYTLPGRCDGLTADPAHDRLIASVNEDLNSSLFVISPGGTPPVVQYTYSPSPAQTGSDGTNGGTDSISIGPDSAVYVAHSNPDQQLSPPNNAAAVYRVTLSGSTASLTPVFGINDSAEVINPTPGSPDTAPLALTDPDSNRLIARGDGGTLIQDAQADSKLVFATHLDRAQPRLRVLNLTNAVQPTGGPATPQLDDIARVGGDGVLYAVDQATGNIYAIDTGGVEPGTLFVAQPKPAAGDLPNDPAIGVVNPRTGVVTHVDSTLGSPKGLVFVPSSGRADDGESGGVGPNDPEIAG